MYNTKLLPDYDAFADSLEDDNFLDNRTPDEKKIASEIYAKEKKIEVENALKNGELIIKDEFNNGKIDVVQYKIKIGALTYVSLTKEEVEFYTTN